MTALVKLLSRLLLAAFALARVARSLGARIDSLPRPKQALPAMDDEVTSASSVAFRRALPTDGAPEVPAQPAGASGVLGIARGMPRWRIAASPPHRVDRDVALVGGLLLFGAVAGYALTAVLGGAAAGDKPLVGQVATATPTSVIPSSEATPPLTGQETATPSAVAVTPSPSEPPPLVPAPTTLTTRLDARLDRGGAPLVELGWEGLPGARFEVGLAALPDGEWQGVPLDEATDAGARLAVVTGRAYRARVRAVTDSGTSAWIESNGFVVRSVDDGQSSVVYDGRWAAAGHPLYMERSASFSRTRGATATLRFTGSSICWRGPVGPGRGRASVFVDGQRLAGVDTRADTFQARRALFVQSWPEASEHRLQLVLEGAGAVAVDAFFVLEAAE
jgi:hypothetical protein